MTINVDGMELNLVDNLGRIVLVVITSFGRSVGRFASRKIGVSLETKQGGKDGIGLVLMGGSGSRLASFTRTVLEERAVGTTCKGHVEGVFVVEGFHFVRDKSTHGKPILEDQEIISQIGF
jgi:hypothetical protein